MFETICPKCRAPKVKDAEFCICGHKWDNYGGLFEAVTGYKEGSEIIDAILGSPKPYKGG